MVVSMSWKVHVRLSCSIHPVTARSSSILEEAGMGSGGREGAQVHSGEVWLGEAGSPRPRSERWTRWRAWEDLHGSELAPEPVTLQYLCKEEVNAAWDVSG